VAGPRGDRLDADLARALRLRLLINRLTERDEEDMNNIFYIIGVVVVVLFILGYLGFR
jgi:hypothetical protein